MINRTLYLIYLFTACILMSNCSIYRPAYQNQQLAYMETPLCKTDSVYVQSYAGGSFGNDVIYQSKDKNTNGAVTAHIAWATLFHEGALGFDGFAGQYTVNNNNLEKKQTYKGGGGRFFSTLCVPITEHVSWQCFGVSVAFHYETGDYTRFRDSIRMAKLIGRRWDDFSNSIEVPISVVAGVSTGVKMRFKKEHALLIRYMFGADCSTVLMLPESRFHQFIVNYQFKKMSIYSSLVVGDRVNRVSLNMPLQLGISVPLHSN